MNARYPSATDYTMALQQPTAAFSSPELREAEFKKGRMGLAVIAGSSAVVFHATISGHDYALRCYTREDASTLDHYAALDTYVASAQLDRYVSRVRWMDQAVQVKGAQWPVLTMEWINGKRLNDHVGDLAERGDTAALRALASQWLTLVSDLQEAQFAHGDLQHGNILVEGGGALRLVDFDSVWIPPLREQPAPTEAGHPSFQPHGLEATERWGAHMDTFPGLVIYLALVALSRDPGLWDKLDNGDNMLFERADFAPPHNTEVWELLAGIGDPEVDRLAAKLQEFCAPGWTATATLRAAIKRDWWLLTGDQEAEATRPSQPRPVITPKVPGTRTTSERPSPADTPRPRRSAADGNGTWWVQPGESETTTPPPTRTPAAKPRQPVAPRPPVSPARRKVGAGVAAFGVLLAVILTGTAPGVGLALGAVLLVVGILLMVVPGDPSPPGT